MPNWVGKKFYELGGQALLEQELQDLNSAEKRGRWSSRSDLLWCPDYKIQNKDKKCKNHDLSIYK